MKRGLSYDDVLLKPSKTSVTSLSDVDTSTELAGIELEVPVVSAAMDTVTGPELSIEIDRLGGLGVLHRFVSPGKQAEMVEKVKAEGIRVAAAIGLSDQRRAEKLVESGVEALFFDIAHGHHVKLLEEVEEYSETYPGVPVVAGNVATAEAAKDLEKHGADAVKVGVGPGSACTTREMTGSGVPQFTAVKECSEAVDIPVIADGGIRKPGDLVKALMAGASTGMIGGMFAGTDETPGEVIGEEGDRFKIYRGMSSREAAEKRAEKEGRELKDSEKVSEGIEKKVEYKGSLEKIVNELQGGLRSAISYCGAENVEDARDNAEFIRVTPSTRYRNGAHIEK